MDNDEWALRKRLQERAEEQQHSVDRPAKDDWREFRKRAAMVAMQGLLSNEKTGSPCDIMKKKFVIASLAVNVADSLIAELRREEIK